MSLRDHTCECSNDRCRARVYLTVAEYRSASKHGLVMSLACARGQQVAYYRPGYAVVRDPLKCVREVARAYVDRKAA